MAAKRNRCFLHVDVHPGSWGVHPFEEPGPHTNAPPCQRQRGLKAAGSGSHDHLQAVFLPIHPARLIECPRLSMPAGVTSYHKPPAPLLIKQWMGGSAIKKRESGTEGEIEERMRAILTDALWRWSCSQSAEGRRAGRSSLLTSYLGFSVKINLASSHLPSDHVVGAAGVGGAGVLRWATKR